MLKKIKAIFKGTTLYDSIYRYKQRKSLLKWEASAVIRKGPLPHILKQYTIKDYASKYNCGILIETGTFEGDMIKAGLLFFQKIYSIELDQYFFLKAVNKFRNHDKVKIIQGDSGITLPEILKEVSSRAVFWLDGHYSAGATAKGELDTPIVKEIESVFNHSIKDHVILIDDARCFDGSNDYPKLDKFINELYKLKSDIRVEVYNDIIRITPDRSVIATHE